MTMKLNLIIYKIFIIYCDRFAQASLYDRPLGAFLRLPGAIVLRKWVAQQGVASTQYRMT
jgi:hypothetical protein